MKGQEANRRTDSRLGRWMLLIVACLAVAYFGHRPGSAPAPAQQTLIPAEVEPDTAVSAITENRAITENSDDGRILAVAAATDTAIKVGGWPQPDPVTGLPIELPEPVEPMESDEPVREPLVINGVGDFNVDPDYIPALRTEGYQHALSGMDGLFLDDDITVINLECPATTIGTPEDKEFTFQCDPAALPIIEEMGVDVANQGNNHSLDFGSDALLDSLANLEAVGIAPVGAGIDSVAAAEPAIFDRRGWTVAVVGFGGVVPAGWWIATEDGPGMADGDTVESMVAAVAAADAVADVVVVTIHWGRELQPGPPPDDVVRAQAMIDAGADMIFGHHPHRLNALEWYQDRPIFWSLGNFVWPSLSAAGSDTAVAQVILDPDGSVTGCLLDTTIVSHGHPQLDDPANRSCGSFSPRGRQK